MGLSGAWLLLVLLLTIPARGAAPDSAQLSPAAARALLLYAPGTLHPPFIEESFSAETALPDTAFNEALEDRWLAFDKVQHVTFSFLWVLGSQYALVNKFDRSEHQALPLSIASSASAGLAKEFYDLHISPSRYFSWRDLVADGLGIALATGLVLL